jgi:cell wall assembly regulator SMI1
MKTIWNRIHAWLKENAPAGFGNLRPGASAKAIADAEKAMGLKLPADVKASYRIHNGQGDDPLWVDTGLVGGEAWRLISLQEIVEQWKLWSQARTAYDHRVPLACNAMSDWVFLDLHPASASRGCLRVQRHDRRQTDPFFSSFSSLLDDFADKLEEGEMVYSGEEGGLVYEDELDLEE